MTDDKSRRGVHDPWRTGVPDPSAASSPVGAQGSAEEMDWDLVPHKWYVFRVGGAALKVVGVDDPVKAVVHLMRVYKRDEKLRNIMQTAGFRPQVTGDTATGFVFKSAEGVLVCPDAVSTEDGLRRLNNALRAAIRKDSSMQAHLNRLGIVPLVE